MPASSLPEDGPLRLRQVSLPPGRRVGSYGGPQVAWVTDEPVQDPGPVWAALSRESPSAGLVPFLAASLEDGYGKGLTMESLALAGGADLGEAYEDIYARYPNYDDEERRKRGDRRRPRGRPWDDGEFSEPEDISGLGLIDSARVQQDLWEGEAPSQEELAEDEDARVMFAPFSHEFPGLAPACHEELPDDKIESALRKLWPSRIGLAAAERPADVLPLIGWDGNCNWGTGTLPLAAVLRSWEDRFGARLLRIGFATISVLATRPPRDLRSAQLLAAEHVVFCDECAGLGMREISSLTKYLLASPVWTFWWD